MTRNDSSYFFSLSFFFFFPFTVLAVTPLLNSYQVPVPYMGTVQSHDTTHQAVPLLVPAPIGIPANRIKATMKKCPLLGCDAVSLL
jgi:hypothetical protein